MISCTSNNAQLPKISIIIPNFNNARYLEHCILSVVNQIYENLEIVVVDDCSTDNSREVLLDLALIYQQLNVVFLECNGGVSHARNVGAFVAAGDYIEFLDADDFFYAPDKLVSEMKLIFSHRRNNKRIIAYSCVVCVNDDGQYVESRGIDDQLEGNILVAYMARYKDDHNARNILIDKQAITCCGYYNETMSFWEDMDFAIRLFSIRQLYCTHKLGTAYRWRMGGLSHQNVRDGTIVQKEIINKYKTKFNLLQYSRYYYYSILRCFRLMKRKGYPLILHKLSLLKWAILNRFGIRR